MDCRILLLPLGDPGIPINVAACAKQSSTHSRLSRCIDPPPDRASLTIFASSCPGGADGPADWNTLLEPLGCRRYVPYACVSIYAHAYSHACLPPYLHAHTYIHTCVHAYIHTYMHTYVYTNTTHELTHLVCAHRHMHTHVCIHIYVYMLYTYIHM